MLNIEKLDTLPLKEARRESLTRRYGDMWNTRFDHYWMRSSSDQYYWVKAKRVIKKYMGKSVDEAFSYYCTLVASHEQKEFFRDFVNTLDQTNEYIIDDKRNIQINPNRWRNKKNPVVFRSFDYKLGYYDIIEKEFVRDASRYWQYLDSGRYIRTVVTGFERTFESKKDPEYQRLQAEKVTAEKRNARLLKQSKKQKNYCFLTNSGLEEKKAKQAA